MTIRSLIRSATFAALLTVMPACGNDEITDADIAGQVVVTVQTDAGAAVPGVTVQLWTDDANAMLWVSGSTNASGTAQPGDGGSVLIGRYLVKVIPPSGYTLAAGQSAAVPIEVRASATTSVTIRLHRTT